MQQEMAVLTGRSLLENVTGKREESKEQRALASVKDIVFKTFFDMRSMALL